MWMINVYPKLKTTGDVAGILFGLILTAMAMGWIGGCVGGDGFVLFKGGSDDKQVLETSGREQDVHRDDPDRGDWDFLEGRTD